MFDPGVLAGLCSLATVASVGALGGVSGSGIGTSMERESAACEIALDMATHRAFPTARWPAREPLGRRQLGGKPISAADSQGLITRTVTPSHDVHVSG